MTRLEKVFNQKETKNKVLVTYTVAGDPNLGSSKKILNDLIASGADILEIGVPSVSYTHLTLPTSRSV